MKSLWVLMFVSSAALADDGAMLRCRQLTEAPARLSCYDAIPLGAAAAAGTAAAPAAMAKPDPVQDFGKEQIAPAAKLDSIQSTIAGDFDGWVANQRIRLANGQVWKIADDSSEETPVVLHNPTVKIERGAMGAIYMDVDGARTAPRVKRVK